jgi:hypothetical protein
MMNPSVYVGADTDATLKPIDLVALLKVELELGPCTDLTPKQIVALANAELARSPIADATVKEEAMACRAAVRALPTSYWTTRATAEAAANQESSAEPVVVSKPQKLVDWILAKPATAGGFAAAVACKVLSGGKGGGMADLRSVVWGGALVIDGFQILRPPGGYCTTDGEIASFCKLLRTNGKAERLGDCTFLVTERSQPAPGQVLMLCAANKCQARLAALATPKWCLLAVYHQAANSSNDTEAATLALLDDLRQQGF